MLDQCIDFVMRAVKGAWSVFESIITAIPGTAELMGVLFFVGIVISLLIMPIRGKSLGGASDTAKKKTEDDDG